MADYFNEHILLVIIVLRGESRQAVAGEHKMAYW